MYYYELHTLSLTKCCLFGYYCKWCFLWCHSYGLENIWFCIFEAVWGCMMTFYIKKCVLRGALFASLLCKYENENAAPFGVAFFVFRALKVF